MKLSLLVLILAAAFGCTPDAARAALTTTAYATVQADKLFADAYEVFSDNARATSTTQAEKDAKMAAWTAAAQKLDPLFAGLYAGLATAELALDAAEQTGERSDWNEAVACLAVKLREVAKVLEERGLKIPAALAKVLSLSEGLTCASG